MPPDAPRLVLPARVAVTHWIGRWRFGLWTLASSVCLVSAACQPRPVDKAGNPLAPPDPPVQCNHLLRGDFAVGTHVLVPKSTWRRGVRTGSFEEGTKRESYLQVTDGTGECWILGSEGKTVDTAVVMRFPADSPVRPRQYYLETRPQVVAHYWECRDMSPVPTAPSPQPTPCPSW